MRSFRFVNSLSLLAVVFVMLFAASSDVSGQSRRDDYSDRYGNESRYERQRRDRQRRTLDRRLSRRDVNVVLLQGYESGLRAGQMDRSRGKFNASNVYRNTPSVPYGGDASSADYLYRQGYLEGYQDGYTGRLRY